MLVLIVSMGCGVVKADLGEARYKVGILQSVHDLGGTTFKVDRYVG